MKGKNQGKIAVISDMEREEKVRGINEEQEEEMRICFSTRPLHMIWGQDGYFTRN